MYICSSWTVKLVLLLVITTLFAPVASHPREYGESTQTSHSATTRVLSRLYTTTDLIARQVLTTNVANTLKIMANSILASSPGLMTTTTTTTTPTTTSAGTTTAGIVTTKSSMEAAMPASTTSTPPSISPLSTTPQSTVPSTTTVTTIDPVQISSNSTSAIFTASAPPYTPLSTIIISPTALASTTYSSTISSISFAMYSTSITNTNTLATVLATTPASCLFISLSQLLDASTGTPFDPQTILLSTGPSSMSTTVAPIVCANPSSGSSDSIWSSMSTSLLLNSTPGLVSTPTSATTFAGTFISSYISPAATTSTASSTTLSTMLGSTIPNISPFTSTVISTSTLLATSFTALVLTSSTRNSTLNTTTLTSISDTASNTVLTQELSATTATVTSLLSATSSTSSSVLSMTALYMTPSLSSTALQTPFLSTTLTIATTTIPTTLPLIVSTSVITVSITVSETPSISLTISTASPLAFLTTPPFTEVIISYSNTTFITDMMTSLIVSSILPSTTIATTPRTILSFVSSTIIPISPTATNYTLQSTTDLTESPHTSEIMAPTSSIVHSSTNIDRSSDLLSLTTLNTSYLNQNDTYVSQSIASSITPIVSSSNTRSTTMLNASIASVTFSAPSVTTSLTTILGSSSSYTFVMVTSLTTDDVEHLTSDVAITSIGNDPILPTSTNVSGTNLGVSPLLSNYPSPSYTAEISGTKLTSLTYSTPRIALDTTSNNIQSLPATNTTIFVYQTQADMPTTTTNFSTFSQSTSRSTPPFETTNVMMMPPADVNFTTSMIASVSTSSAPVPSTTPLASTSLLQTVATESFISNTLSTDVVLTSSTVSVTVGSGDVRTSSVDTTSSAASSIITFDLSINSSMTFMNASIMAVETTVSNVNSTSHIYSEQSLTPAVSDSTGSSQQDLTSWSSTSRVDTDVSTAMMVTTLSTDSNGMTETSSPLKTLTPDLTSSSFTADTFMLTVSVDRGTSSILASSPLIDSFLPTTLQTEVASSRTDSFVTGTPLLSSILSGGLLSTSGVSLSIFTSSSAVESLVTTPSIISLSTLDSVELLNSTTMVSTLSITDTPSSVNVATLTTETFSSPLADLPTVDATQTMVSSETSSNSDLAYLTTSSGFVADTLISTTPSTSISYVVSTVTPSVSSSSHSSTNVVSYYDTLSSDLEPSTTIPVYTKTLVDLTALSNKSNPLLASVNDADSLTLLPSAATSSREIVYVSSTSNIVSEVAFITPQTTTLVDETTSLLTTTFLDDVSGGTKPLASVDSLAIIETTTISPSPSTTTSAVYITISSNTEIFESMPFTLSTLITSTVVSQSTSKEGLSFMTSTTSFTLLSANNTNVVADQISTLTDTALELITTSTVDQITILMNRSTTSTDDLELTASSGSTRITEIPTTDLPDSSDMYGFLSTTVLSIDISSEVDTTGAEGTSTSYLVSTSASVLPTSIAVSDPVFSSTITASLVPSNSYSSVALLGDPGNISLVSAVPAVLSIVSQPVFPSQLGSSQPQTPLTINNLTFTTTAQQEPTPVVTSIIVDMSDNAQTISDSTSQVVQSTFAATPVLAPVQIPEASLVVSEPDATSFLSSAPSTFTLVISSNSTSTLTQRSFVCRAL